MMVTQITRDVRSSLVLHTLFPQSKALSVVTCIICSPKGGGVGGGGGGNEQTNKL